MARILLGGRFPKKAPAKAKRGKFLNVKQARAAGAY